jgi:type VI secretion system secreted protein Hcp
MAVDAFLKIDGIKGESKDHAYKDQIDILSWSWGMTQTGSFSSGGGGGSGKVNVSDINIMKRVDASSPALMVHCCNGKHIKSATLVMRKAGDKPLEYLKIVFEDIIVSSVQHSQGGSDIPMESLSLSFSRFKSAYQPQGADGAKAGGELTAGWDVSANKPVG